MRGKFQWDLVKLRGPVHKGPNAGSNHCARRTNNLTVVQRKPEPARLLIDPHYLPWIQIRNDAALKPIAIREKPREADLLVSPGAHFGIIAIERQAPVRIGDVGCTPGGTQHHS